MQNKAQCKSCVGKESDLKLTKMGTRKKAQFCVHFRNSNCSRVRDRAWRLRVESKNLVRRLPSDPRDKYIGNLKG